MRAVITEGPGLDRPQTGLPAPSLGWASPSEGGTGLGVLWRGPRAPQGHRKQGGDAVHLGKGPHAPPPGSRERTPMHAGQGNLCTPKSRGGILPTLERGAHAPQGHGEQGGDPHAPQGAQKGSCPPWERELTHPREGTPCTLKSRDPLPPPLRKGPLCTLGPLGMGR